MFSNKLSINLDIVDCYSSLKIEPEILYTYFPRAVTSVYTRIGDDVDKGIVDVLMSFYKYIYDNHQLMHFIFELDENSKDEVVKEYLSIAGEGVFSQDIFNQEIDYQNEEKVIDVKEDEIYPF